MPKVHIIRFMFAVLCTTGCEEVYTKSANQQYGTNSDAGLVSRPPEPSASTVEETLNERIKGVETRITNLELKNSSREFSERDRGVAVLDVTKPEYSLVADQTKFYAFMVSCKEVESISDGQRVTLEIANPYSVQFADYTLYVTYGARPPETVSMDDAQKEGYIDKVNDWGKKYSEWSKSLKSKTFTPVEVLRPGMWNSVTLTFAPAKPEDIVYLQIGISISKIFASTSTPK